MSKFGHSFIELIVATALLSLVIYMIFFLWSSVHGVSDEIADNTTYYQTVGVFLAQLKMDLLSATKVEKKDGDLILRLPQEADEIKTSLVIYHLDQKRGEITRKEEANIKTFSFGRTSNVNSKLIFKIE